MQDPTKKMQEMSDTFSYVWSLGDTTEQGVEYLMSVRNHAVRKLALSSAELLLLALACFLNDVENGPDLASTDGGGNGDGL